MPRYSVVPAITGRSSEPVVFGLLDESWTDRLLIGRLHEQGPLRPVYADVSSEMVVAIFGKRGSGKSYTLGVLMEGLCAPRGETAIATSSGQRGALLFDTLNVFWSLGNPLRTDEDRRRFPTEIELLRSWGLTPPELDVAVWVPSGFRRDHTPSAYSDLTIAPSALSSDDVADLLELDPQRDLMGQLVVEVHERAHERYSVFTFERLLDLLEQDEEIREYYADATVRGVRQRLRALARLPIFQKESGTRIGELVKGGCLSVVELGELPNSLRAVVASVILKRIYVERAQASDAEKHLALDTRLEPEEKDRLSSFLETAIPPCWVLVDEAQNILPASRSVKSSDAVVRFVREGRNFGLSFALTTQQPSAVDQRILAQADTVICHKLTVAQDIARVRDNLKSAEPAEVKLSGSVLDLATWLRSLEPGAAIVTNTDFGRVFALQVRPRVTPHGGTGFNTRGRS